MDWSANSREPSLSTSPILGLQEGHHARFFFTVCTGVVCQIKVPVLMKQVLITTLWCDSSSSPWAILYSRFTLSSTSFLSSSFPALTLCAACASPEERPWKPACKPRFLFEGGPPTLKQKEKNTK